MHHFFPFRRSAIIALAITVIAGFTYTLSVSADQDILPTGKRIGTKQNHDQGGPNRDNGKPRPPSTNGISYHGGPVLTAGSNVYYIWYGNWGGNSATTILPALATGLNASPYFNINTTYHDGSGKAVQNAASLAGQYIYPNTQYGTALTDANVQSIVSTSISAGGVAYDSNGVYFVLTAPGITETSGFCTQYCGWHTHFTFNGADVKYAFVGDAENQCASSCEEQTVSSPNGNPGADGMASVIAHELEEATTDPDLNAWYDTRGNENADKCAWTFGTTSTASNGSKYNVTFMSGAKFLIQQNWVNASGGYCAMSF